MPMFSDENNCSQSSFENDSTLGSQYGSSTSELDQLKAENKELYQQTRVSNQNKEKTQEINVNLELMLTNLYRMIKERNVATDTKKITSECTNVSCGRQFSSSDEQYPCVQCGNVCCKCCYYGLGDEMFFCGKCRHILGQVEKHFASGGTAQLLAEESGSSGYKTDHEDLNPEAKLPWPSFASGLHLMSSPPPSITELDTVERKVSTSDDGDGTPDLCYEIPCQLPVIKSNWILLNNGQAVYIVLQIFVPKTSCSWSFEAPSVTKGVVMKFAILYREFESEEEETLMPMKRLNMSKTSPISGNLVAKCCGSYIFKLTSAAGDAINISYEVKIDTPQSEESY